MKDTPSPVVPQSISAYLMVLVTKYPGIQNIWLYGSGVYDPCPEDWDILIYAETSVYESVQKEGRPGLTDKLHLLITKEIFTDNEIFESPWEDEDGHIDRLDGIDLEWKETENPDVATYIEKPKNSITGARRRAEARRLWHRRET